MTRRGSRPQQSGTTTDGKAVLSGVFPLLGTHGLPLEIILTAFQSRNQVIDWPDFITGALRDGWKLRTIRARCLAAVGDVYGPKYRDEWLARFDRFTSPTAEPAPGPSSPSHEAAAGPCNGNDGSSASGSPVIPVCTDAPLPAAAASYCSTEGPHGAGQEQRTEPCHA